MSHSTILLCHVCRRGAALPTYPGSAYGICLQCNARERAIWDAQQAARVLSDDDSDETTFDAEGRL